MNKEAIFHRAKSEYAYAYDENTLHILIRTQHNDFNKVEIIYGDPFDWINKNGQAIWQYEIGTMIKRYQTKSFDYYFMAVKPKDLRFKYAFLLTKDEEVYFYGSKRMELIENNLNLSLMKQVSMTYLITLTILLLIKKIYQTHHLGLKIRFGIKYF